MPVHTHNQIPIKYFTILLQLYFALFNFRIVNSHSF